VRNKGLKGTLVGYEFSAFGNFQSYNEECV